MEDTFLSFLELEWLSINKNISTDINELLDDSKNVNPLENGMPDLAPYRSAIIALKITINASVNKYIRGPYNENHLQIINTLLPNIIPTEISKSFWSRFSFECACAFDEDNDSTQEIIYLKAMIEMIRINIEGELYDLNESAVVANLNTNSLQKIKGEGVHATLKNF
jgi:hypothetical protein